MFKECKAWKKEIRELWKAVSEGVGHSERREGHVLKGKKGFGYGVRKGNKGPGNTTIRELLGDERYTEAVVEFLRVTKVGQVKEGMIKRD